MRLVIHMNIVTMLLIQKSNALKTHRNILLVWLFPKPPHHRIRRDWTSRPLLSLFAWSRDRCNNYGQLAVEQLTQICRGNRNNGLIYQSQRIKVVLMMACHDTRFVVC